MKTTKYTWRRFRLALGLAIFFGVMGWGVRMAEDSQVGYTNDTSMWIFAVSALCVYYAVIVLIVRWRIRRNGEQEPRHQDYWD